MSELKMMATMAAIVVGLLLGVWVFMSKMEANAFNAVTGKSVSTWNAMWIQLRVQDAASLNATEHRQGARQGGSNE